ncbi:reductive dehalogenase [Salinilacihabitans rarus]|uniref:reductive dehalogenase n=1 Tax=Salinilacihabitans rarus TaxID=2961596 RepID=UPI0020C83727|nr:reductive dehalogenase [Salinilacihabitans rarus]
MASNPDELSGGVEPSDDVDDLPEGLQEMAKHEGEIDRREMEETYEDLFEDIVETEVDRRAVLGAFAGGGGLAVLNALFAQKLFFGDDFESGMKAVASASDAPLGVRKVDDPPYEVDDDVYERIDASKHAIRHPDLYGETSGDIGEPDASESDPITQIENAWVGRGSVTIGNMDPYEASSVGEARALWAINDARARPGWGAHVNRAETTFYEKHGLDDDELATRAPDLTDPADLTHKVKKLARMMGVGAVGVADVDERWIYETTQFGQTVEIGDYDRIHGDDGTVYFPESYDKAIVIAIEMPRNMGRTGQSLASGLCSNMGYERQGYALETMSLWIEHMGYRAIPSGNDLAATVPLAIDAGLGEHGRHARLIHPQFGSNLRVSKIFTDMPLESDDWIRFGANEFCDACKICAHQCPAGAIPTGTQTWESPYPGTQEHKNPGVRKWYNDGARCRKFWGENGTNDSACMNACPFTQGRSWLHEIVRWQAGISGTVDGMLATMSRAFGYEQPLPAEAIWEMDWLPYGIYADPGLGTF